MITIPTALFEPLPGASFVVNGARGDPDAALVSAGGEMKRLSGFSLAATFEGEFSDNTTTPASSWHGQVVSWAAVGASIGLPAFGLSALAEAF